MTLSSAKTNIRCEGIRLACEQGEGKERRRGKWKPLEMAKDFDFQMSVIYVIFNFTIQVASTTTTANFEKKLLSYEVGSVLFFAKLENQLVYQIFN